MPHATHGYLFESQVLKFVHELSEKFTNQDSKLLIEFNESGSSKSIHFESPGSSIYELRSQMVARGCPYIFYDPFDLPEYMFLCWNQVEQATMERLIGRKFEESEFVKNSLPMNSAPDLQSPNAFPASWQVMF